MWLAALTDSARWLTRSGGDSMSLPGWPMPGVTWPARATSVWTDTGGRQVPCWMGNLAISARPQPGAGPVATGRAGSAIQFDQEPA